MIVRDFYAHLHKVMDDKAMVSRVLVPFGSYAITSHYEMKGVRHGENKSYLEGVHYEEVM